MAMVRGIMIAVGLVTMQGIVIILRMEIIIGGWRYAVNVSFLKANWNRQAGRKADRQTGKLMYWEANVQTN